MIPIRILLAEDHRLVRAGIRALVEELSNVQVVAEAGSGLEALQLVEEHRPNVVLMDIAMPGLGGLEATKQIAEDFPEVQVIILSMHANEEYVLQTLYAGAAGYLLKDASTAELEIAITAVSRGETYLSPAVSKHLTDYVRRTGEPSSLQQLTPRQRQTLQLIAEGYSTKEIAAQLNISVKTAETHRARLMERLEIYDIPGLVRYAIRVGLISTD